MFYVQTHAAKPIRIFTSSTKAIVHKSVRVSKANSINKPGFVFNNPMPSGNIYICLKCSPETPKIHIPFL